MKRILVISALLLTLTPLMAEEAVTDSLCFEAMGSVSPSSFLRGKVAGVRVSASEGGVNSAVNTIIRGLNSVRASSEPLWVVDGVVLNSSINQNQEAFWQPEFGHKSYTSVLNPLAFINPNDIESIEVLKDASATSMYGSRGANGVIIVHTKLPRTEGREILWNSNLATAFDASGAGLKPTVSHNHNVSFAGCNNRNSYRVSGMFRSLSGIVEGDRATQGGLSVNFDSRANKKIWFGLRSTVGAGKMDSQSGTCWYGGQSATTTLRNTGTIGGFATDYDDEANDYRAIADAYLQLNILPYLHWKTDLGVDYNNNTRYIWYGKGTNFGAESNGAAALISSSMFQFGMTSRLDYEVFVAKDHHIRLGAGVELYGNLDKFNTMNGVDFFNHQLRAKGISFAAGKPTIHKFSRELFHKALFGSFSYDYKGILGLNAGLRGDNTSRYYDGKFLLYPSVEVRFNAGKLLPERSAISSLGLNAGYGKSGRETFAPYELFNMYSPNLFMTIQEGTETLYEGLVSLLSSEWHVGVNVGAFSDRLRLEAVFYQKLTNDKFSRYVFGENNTDTIRWSKGGRVFLDSDESSIRNRGLEFELTAIPIRKRGFEWKIAANVAFQSNQITSIAEADRFGGDLGTGIVSNYNELGRSVSSIIGLASDGEMAILGNPSPRVFGGFETSVTWNRFAAELCFDGAAGHSIFNMNRMQVEKADFFRMGRASLSYNIPFKKKHLDSIAFRLSALNPLLLTSYSGYNPDVDCFSKSAFTRGIDYGRFPSYRSFIFGASIRF